jgi:hypothetical protein
MASAEAALLVMPCLPDALLTQHYLICCWLPKWLMPVRLKEPVNVACGNRIWERRLASPLGNVNWSGFLLT